MKYFKSQEFDCPTLPNSGEGMNRELLKMIDKVRHIYGYPITITSGWRSKEHNTAVGGKSGSSHLKGLAIDISAPNSRSKYELLKIILEVGFNRIGIGGSFIHVDVDPDKSNNVIWTY